MSALDSVPQNINFLSPLGFRFMVKKLPNVNFFLQGANLPKISIDPTGHPTPFVHLPISGEHIQYSNLKIVFKVDEDLKNYTELQDWLRGLGFPEDFSEHKEIVDAGDRALVGRGGGIWSHCSLMILTNLKNPNIEITFLDAFPISLGETTFQTTDDDVTFIVCDAEFKYQRFDISIIP